MLKKKKNNKTMYNIIRLRRRVLRSKSIKPMRILLNRLWKISILSLPQCSPDFSERSVIENENSNIPIKLIQIYILIDGNTPASQYNCIVSIPISKIYTLTSVYILK